MKSLETILDRMIEQGITIDPDDKIVIPEDECYVNFNGTKCAGRVFLEEGIIVTLLPFDDTFNEKEFDNHPCIWKIKDTYETWLSNGFIAHRVQFYVVR